ncbi:MAG: tRNA-dihydrouridine synthase, partial [Candidatus Veblenbacteria bacterium]|nr:tRNA-dihydrouridine synthase [Candidatus Veblenbacteria bacterium]
MQNFWQQLPKPILALAPMAGVTDTPFRQMCKRYGADVIYTEFASVDALCHGNARTREMITFEPSEQPVVCQIFGRKPELFSGAVKILEEMGFSGVDINFGCPAYKVVKTGGGVKLMRNPALCHELIQAACEGSGLPVSIKIRASIKRGADTKDKVEDKEAEAELDKYESTMDTVTALDLVNKVKNLPLAAIMLHARSYEQPFDGVPDTNMLKEVRKIWPGILIANGGIYSPEKAKEILEDTGADGVGVARGSWGKPWLFQQIKDYLAHGTYQQISWEETKNIMLEHAELALSAKGEYGLIELRKHLAWYTKGIPGASQIRAKLVQVKSIGEVRNIIEQA